MALPAITNAQSYDLEITQGGTLTRACALYLATLGDTNLTGCTFVAKIRATYDSAAPLIVALTIDTTLIAVGQWVLSLTAAQTGALTSAIPAGTTPQQGRVAIGVWDLYISDGTNTYRFAYGNVYLNREVSF